MDPTTVLHKVVHGDSIENACPTKRVNRTSSCTPQPSIYVTSIEPRKLPHRSWGPVPVVDPQRPFEGFNLERLLSQGQRTSVRELMHDDL